MRRAGLARSARTGLAAATFITASASARARALAASSGEARIRPGASGGAFAMGGATIATSIAHTPNASAGRERRRLKRNGAAAGGGRKRANR